MNPTDMNYDNPMNGDQPHDGPATKRPRVDTPIAAHDIAAVGLSTRQSLTTEAAQQRRMILHHLGIRDPSLPARPTRIEESSRLEIREPILRTQPTWWWNFRD